MTSDEARNRAMERIRAAIELARGTNNVNEAALAMQKAQELAFKYQIDIETVPERETAAVEFVDERFGLGVKFGVPLQWRRDLVYSLCNANLCRTAYIPSTPYVYIFGTKGSLEIVKFMYETLTRELERLATQGWKEYCELKPGAPYIQGREVQWRDSFYKGAAAELHQRLRTSKDKWLREVPPESKALVYDRKKAVDNAWNEAHSTRKGEGTTVGNSDGYYAGKRAGANVQFDAPLPSSFNGGGLLHE